jgi:methyl-accepting chemotaxis protein
VTCALVFAVLWFTIRNLNRELHLIGERLGENSEYVASQAYQISSASQSLAQGASEQASSLEETGASLEQMSSMTRQNVDSIQKADAMAREAREVAEEGVRDMQQMNSAMQAIKVSSDEIAKIIKTIDEIAFQTNILALNAAVEAARAGESGMGFAVVADEVRNLAQRSAESARETSQKIQDAMSCSSRGLQISGKVKVGLEKIAERVRRVNELVTEVATASKEHSQGISQVNDAVRMMDKVTQSNASAAEESAASSEELKSQANRLKDLVTDLLGLVGSRPGSVTCRNSSPRNEAANGNDRRKIVSQRDSRKDFILAKMAKKTLMKIG